MKNLLSVEHLSNEEIFTILDRASEFENGASDYISKPLNLEQLFSLLTVWLTSEANSING